jgi:hypothetical protein
MNIDPAPGDRSGASPKKFRNRKRIMKTKFNHYIALFVLALMALFVTVWRPLLTALVPDGPPLVIPILALLLSTLAGLVLALAVPRVRDRVSRIKLFQRLKPGWLVPLLLVFFAVAPARAAEWDAIGTFWRVTDFTNATATATNLDTAIDVREFSEFTLEVQAGLTNASTGTIDLRWTTSNDGTKYSAAPAAPGASGWFSVPLTGAGTSASWRTNIPVGSYRNWKISWSTNVAGQHMTNVLIRAYGKPVKRNLY